MKKSLTLCVLMSVFLLGCATGPTDPQLKPIPMDPVNPPQLPALDKVPLGPTFTDRMELFLSGKLPEQISYDLLLVPAIQPGIKPRKPLAQ
jgi:hypothetical protein